ncbi:MAG TPA: SCO2523 family variant P-loop protein [Pseudonocardiaceae bacterium]
MLVFATSDKGGTGRSVTSSNVAYRRALQGGDVCYLDFDFGSPTAGAVFAIDSLVNGAPENGLHSYLLGKVDAPTRLDVWTATDRAALRGRPPAAGRLALLPGDSGGGEFRSDADVIRRCVTLLLRLEEEFELCLVDLSAGRSYATQIVLAATATPEMREVTCRWLVFHRWTTQHINAAANLVHGRRGILDVGAELGHERDRLATSLRFVRTAVVDPDSPELAGLRPPQVAWLREFNGRLQAMASARRVGRTSMLAAVPLDPVLQWREQLISDDDVSALHIANQATVDAFDTIAKCLFEDAAWESL